MLPVDVIPAVRTALNTMGDNPGDLGPQPLMAELWTAAKRWRIADTMVALIAEELLSEDANATPRALLTRFLHRWDHMDASWADKTKPNTHERRQRIYKLLEVTDEFRTKCDRLIPARVEVEEPTVIADQHEEWYSEARKGQHGFYWNAYTRYLREENHWAEPSIIDLDRATDLVVERLSDPERRELYQTKGLVVGYVQSGKTANFTAVIAKAADAGYRLIIVLAGTLDILREQTQRRLDKELIGRELLSSRPEGSLEHDYAGDAEWGQFIRHGGRPSELGAFDWQRLTGAKEDYRSLRRGIDALEFVGRVLGRRYNDPANLHSSTARLIVVKKNPAVLKKLAKDLGALRGRLDEVPALIIDDESDQASVNTVKPGSDKERTATSREICGLLKTLKRAQYIGYTATPFANVFINPDDAEDLFPKDYIIPLGRPGGYMGVRDFHDLDGEKPEGFASKEKAFVRGVEGEDVADDNLLRAIDAFVLAGALKLYRQRQQPELRFKHHTMLVHRSHQMVDHADDADLVRSIYENAGYRGGAGLVRLKRLYVEDFEPVHDSQEPSLPFPQAFGELEPFIGECLQKIGSQPVGVVNGDVANRDQTPNFDKDRVWRILVGGTKLSRGYTVEGLTISYYRRRAGNADTLMQMGRWFGFRRGYRDLVRLFIGRAEPDGKRTVDLYEAFESICRDEEQFRAQLKRYSKQAHPRVLPRHVPPLVPSHMLMPTARNKMYNAQLVSQNFGGDLVERTMIPRNGSPALAANRELVSSLLDRFPPSRTTLALSFDGKQAETTALTCLVEHGEMLGVLQDYQWTKPGVLSPVIEFLQGGLGNPGIRDWLFFAPQVSDDNASARWSAGAVDFNVVYRARIDDSDRIKAFTEPRHRKFAEMIAGLRVGEPLNAATEKLVSPGRAVFLFYPCVDVERQTDETKSEKASRDIIMGFALLLPANSLSVQMAFKVRDESQQDAVVVDLTTDGAQPKRQRKV
ncbi:Z1 domain-containing protein [Corallococcus exiguus]|uniref:Z1 domain-containing protein n=1 Tax=Corallococcus exiguus TaxID=83462 RepID=UPI00155F7895|nr:Z1 domain-containing protein [Corallococcus exiguus]NRD48803.1 Z1 domain-containing protein [Corallococcus exiguus]